MTTPAGARQTVIDHTRPPSIKNMTADEIAVNVDRVGARSGWPFLANFKHLFEKQAQRALFEGKYANELLPGLKVVWLSCSNSMFMLLWAKSLVEGKYRDHVAKGDTIRPIEFLQIEGANHFVSNTNVFQALMKWIKC